MEKKLIRKVPLLFLLLLLITNQTYSQKVYNIDAAIETALQNNIEAKIARMEVKKAQAAVDEAYGYALPSVDFSASLSHFLEKPQMPFPDFNALLNNATYGVLFQEEVIPYDESKLMPMDNVLQAFALANNYEAKMQLTQILFNSAVLKGISASGMYLETSKYALKARAATTVTDVKRAFYGVLLTKDILQIAKSSLANFEDNVNNLRALKAQGLVSEFDLLTAEVQLENFRPRVLEAENGLENAKNGLKIIMGLDQKEEIDVEGTLNYNKDDSPELQAMISESLENNFDLLTLKNKRKVDEAMIDLNRSEWWPQLVGFADYTFAGSADDWNFQNYRSSMVGLSFQINLFQGGRTQKKVEQGKITVMQTDQQIELFKEAIKMQIQEKILQLDRINKNIAAQEQNISLAERGYEIAKVRMKEGTGTQLELLNAELQLRTARTNKLQSVYEHIVAVSELNKLRGNIEAKYIQIVNKDN